MLTYYSYQHYYSKKAVFLIKNRRIAEITIHQNRKIS